MYFPSLLAHCSFDKEPNLDIVILELGILVTTVLEFLTLSKWTDKIGLRYLVMSVGVLIFELFTAPMWHNYKMGWWAYIYHDVSWILTLGWTTLILAVVLGVDHFCPQWQERHKYLLALGIITPIAFILEIMVVNLGMRGYAPEVLASISGIQIQGVPLESLYYIPVFTGLVISFYKYWCFILEDQLIVPVKKRKWGRGLGLCFVGVLLFELMIEPMVDNQGLPQWSYIFHDISVIMSGLWILVIAIAGLLVMKYFIHFPIVAQFLIALGITGVIATPLESFFVIQGYRVYGESAVQNFTGFTIPVIDVPIEIAVAIPFYMALIIGFIRYWEITLDNQL